MDELIGGDSLSTIQSMVDVIKKARRQKRINIRRELDNFGRKFPPDYFQPRFDLFALFNHFEFDESNYTKLLIYMKKYVDRASIANYYLIRQKKQSLMSLIGKVFEVSAMVASAKQTLVTVKFNFIQFVDKRAKSFIIKRNLQMKKLRLEVYLHMMDWLRQVRDRFRAIRGKIRGHCIDGIFGDYNDLQNLLDEEIQFGREIVGVELLKKKKAFGVSLVKYKETFKQQFLEIKKVISRLFLDRFRYHFKEFLMIDLSMHIPIRTRENLFKFLAGSEFSPSWQSQRTTRAMWDPENFGTVLDAKFMKKQFDNRREIMSLTQKLDFLSKAHPYPDESPSSFASLNMSQSLNESQDLKSSRREVSASMLNESDVSMRDHALIVSKLFVIMNQLMTFDTSIFSNEIMNLFNPLSKQLESGLLKVKNNTEVEVIKKIMPVKQLKIKLSEEYFELLWSFLMRLLLLAKVNAYAIISCSRNKGVLITDSYIVKILNDFFFLLNNVAKRIMVSLEEFLKKLFKHGLNFEELLGLKKIFMYIFRTSQEQLFANLKLSEENFSLSEEELKQLDKIRKRVSPESFYNFLWKIELFTIKNFANGAIANLKTDVENENWGDLNVSFDIVDMLRFILNTNNFVRKMIDDGLAGESKVESENTLLRIQQKQFR